jgi:hypothetical protein
MKKTMIVLAVMGMVLACSQAVFAQTSKLWVFDGLMGPDGNWIRPPTDIVNFQGGIHANGHGYVTFQATKKGVVVTVVLQQAAQKYTYSVQHGPLQDRNYLTTDKKGNGSVQFTVDVAHGGIMGGSIIIHEQPTSVSTDTPLWYAYNWFCNIP